MKGEIGGVLNSIIEYFCQDFSMAQWTLWEKIGEIFFLPLEFFSYYIEFIIHSYMYTKKILYFIFIFYHFMT